MSAQWPELGSTINLMRVQHADLALAHALMRERARMEQDFIGGLRALVEQYKPAPEEENREYSKVLIDAFEQEIKAHLDINPKVPEQPMLDDKELSVGSELAQELHAAHKKHEDNYTKLLASKDELKAWSNEIKTDPAQIRMPLVELEYRLSVHRQRESARNLQAWYNTQLPPLVESHHSILENTKSSHDKRNKRKDWFCNNLLPLGYRASIGGKMDIESNSQALRPVDYCNWFFDGRPSPLRFGIGTLECDLRTLHWSPSVTYMLNAERDDVAAWSLPPDLNGVC
ncbi:SubName: Full=Uncharacterized protein {ECO:0000313/EMBL:CCA69281.1} [Serendipita indica DSM 11827]|nr:SubName: Full=Uncharacterized protein {ECO:0000313/EMBL:CCA69281.1} [Serendipita indica DSM 11827]